MHCAGEVRVPLKVSFTVPERPALVVPPVALELQATGRELPVSVLTPTLDLR